jgi:hypothetical protein
MIFFPSEGRSARDFITLKKSSLSAGFESAILVSNCKHDNHYTPENDLTGQSMYNVPKEKLKIKTNCID